MDSLHTVTDDYDMIIVDEAHNFGSTARTKKKGQKRATGSTRVKLMKRIAVGKPIIFISATPSAQGLYMLYNQFNLCSWSPWNKYKTFYSWFDVYGIPEIVYTRGGARTIRTKTQDDKVMADVKKYFITYTRADLGFTQEPVDQVHYVEPPQLFKDIYNTLQKHKVIELDGHTIVADTDMSLRTKLHQLEGGTIKYKPVDSDDDNERVTLILDKLAFKVEYMLKHWPDSPKLAIMYEYIAEKELLQRYYKEAEILQGSAFAEGYDLSHMDTLVVYSMSFRTVKYIQRRARQCGLHREDPIIVHYPLVKGAISDQVYKTVAINKTNYTDKYYTREFLD
jgi:hypothetical protein